MRRAKLALVLGILLIGGCERPAPDRSGQGIDADSPLEIAARERRVVNPDAETPVGVFERSHDLGRDAMCVVPDGPGSMLVGRVIEGEGSGGAVKDRSCGAVTP